MQKSDDNGIVIRKYAAGDRPALRRICCDTALMGEPSSAFFDDDEVFADALTSYFTDHEPESSFVAECGGEVVGYIIGSVNVARMGKVFISSLAAPLIAKALMRGVFFRGGNLKFLSRLLLSSVKGEFRAPDFSKIYPATLHINIAKAHRSSGIGSRLIGAYVDYLKARQVKGVHCATMSDGAGRFFGRLGFDLLVRSKRSYFRYFLNKDVPVYIYGMKIMAP